MMNRQHRLQTTVGIAPPPLDKRAGKSSHAANQQSPKSDSGSPVSNREVLHRFLKRLLAFFSSLRLTVVCLGVGLVLVFIGTLAQVDLGLYKAQNEFFRSFFIYWGPKGTSWKIPVFPGATRPAGKGP